MKTWGPYETLQGHGGHTVTLRVSAETILQPCILITVNSILSTYWVVGGIGIKLVQEYTQNGLTQLL